MSPAVVTVDAAPGLDANREEDGMEESQGRMTVVPRGRARARRGHRRSKPLTGEVVELLLASRRLLPAEELPHPEHVVDHHSARRVLTTIWRAALGGAAGLAPGGGTAEVDAELLGLLQVVRELDEKILLALVRERDQALRRVYDGLTMLAEAKSSKALIDLAAATACGLGFDRSMVSRVENSMWVPERGHIERDALWAKEIVEAGRAHPRTLDPNLPETEMVRRKRSILIDQVQERPGVHRVIAEASRTRSYCAAPIKVHGAVAGFVHVDCYYQRRDLDDSDRQVLSIFAECLGQALTRTVVLDRLERARAELDQLVRRAHSAGGEAGAHDVWAGSTEPRAVGEPSRARSAGAGPLPPSGPADRMLTRREVEVLRLMAEGDTNARIARRLVISEGTVKSHVKHILRKLGAANRAEAVSQWLRMGQGHHAVLTFVQENLDTCRYLL